MHLRMPITAVEASADRSFNPHLAVRAAEKLQSLIDRFAPQIVAYVISEDGKGGTDGVFLQFRSRDDADAFAAQLGQSITLAAASTDTITLITQYAMTFPDFLAYSADRR